MVVTESAHPAIEFVLADGVIPGSWTGVAAMAEQWQELLTYWGDWLTEVEEYPEIDRERVLVLHRVSGRGKASGLDFREMRANAAIVFQLCDCKVTMLVLHWDRDRAPADLGLGSGGRPPGS